LPENEESGEKNADANHKPRNRPSRAATMVERERIEPTNTNEGDVVKSNGVVMHDKRTVALPATKQALTYRYRYHLGCDDEATPMQMLDVIQFHDLLPESICGAMRGALGIPRDFDAESINVVLIGIEQMQKRGLA
jgi:hypothetical protein